MAADYPKTKADVGCGSAVLQSGRVSDRGVVVKPELAGTVIVIHGVNDVGVSYGDVESGICAGLTKRLRMSASPAVYRAATYRQFLPSDVGKLEDDPDAVFFKRKTDSDTYSPVIPFYWGYREESRAVQPGDKQIHGQNLDRYGNRLDKDGSKEGGPFANATNTLPDMWGPGKWRGPFRMLDRANKDPQRPVLDCPGRLYMVLAACRLAALITMIRDYDANDVVSIVAHSQGCMISLLAQALLLQWKERPADTLILTHPPYSLIDDIDATVMFFDSRQSGQDALMAGRYDALRGAQTMRARVMTLANIVKGVASHKSSTPQWERLADPCHHGMVGAQWQATADRDNRGKVYLYFCPEDMTVGLSNVKGIGWQGVPDILHGQQKVEKDESFSYNGVTTLTGRKFSVLEPTVLRPMEAMGKGFFQRVFTGRKRPDPVKGKTVVVGQKQAHDHALLLPGEDEFGHAAEMTRTDGGRYARADQDQANPAMAASTRWGARPEDVQRQGMRRINGESLPEPVAPDLHAGALSASDPRVPKGAPVGSYESVDPIDAQIATTSVYGHESIWELIDDAPGRARAESVLQASPAPDLHAGPVVIDIKSKERTLSRINQDKKPGQLCGSVEAVYQCLDGTPPRPTGKLLLRRAETAAEERLRLQQRGRSTRSFHGAIFGSAKNHQNVTAYDVAIGGGKAVSDPEFCAYLCAVADWRVKKIKQPEKLRPSIMEWAKFAVRFESFLSKEPSWRRTLIEGTCDYYTKGTLPSGTPQNPVIPVLPEGLPATVICETLDTRPTTPTESVLSSSVTALIRPAVKSPTGHPAQSGPLEGSP